jgi:hypothetical protein
MKWISIKDARPEEDDFVAVLFDDGEIYYCLYRENNFIQSNGINGIILMRTAKIEHISHWCKIELPEVPKILNSDEINKTIIESMIQELEKSIRRIVNE